MARKRRPKKPKKRNYRKEYKRRKLRQMLGGQNPPVREKHRKGYVATPRSRLLGLSRLGIWDRLKEGEIDLEDQDEFIDALKDIGFSEREAYAHWHSP